MSVVTRLLLVLIECSLFRDTVLGAGNNFTVFTATSVVLAIIASVYLSMHKISDTKAEERLQVSV